MKNVFDFILEALFVLKMFKFCSDFFDHEEKRFDEKAKVKFNIYEITTWQRSNYNTHINRI